MSTSTVVIVTAVVWLTLLHLPGVVDGLECVACQGTQGSSCDANPERVMEHVRCNGTCVTRRTLFANGRTLRTIWRGCDTTLFPLVLREESRDACAEGNFFVECTSTCRGDLCNKLTNGIPWCWDCSGYLQPCTAPSKSGAHDCPHPEMTTTPEPSTLTLCITCSGNPGGDCDENSHLIPSRVQCNSSCITRKTLIKSSRALLSVWRGCVDSLFPGTLSLDALNNCDDSGSDYVECTELCDGRNCNKYTDGFTDCWTKRGTLKYKCDSRAVPGQDIFDEYDLDESKTTPDPVEARAKLFDYKRGRGKDKWRYKSSASGVTSNYSVVTLLVLVSTWMMITH